MHYHIVVMDNGTERPESTVYATLSEAEGAVPEVLQLITDKQWSPRRYPGRPASRGEMVVYLDRTDTQQRRELRIIRCPSASPNPDPDCQFWARH